MFNNSAELVVDAQKLRVTFKQIRTLEQIKTVVDHLIPLLKATVGHPIRRNVATVWATGILDSPDAYRDYMKQFTVHGHAISSGGKILVSTLPDWSGEVRIATEKWLAHE